MADRLIDIPGQEREPSEALLERLREVDSRIDVLYIGAGRWILIRVMREEQRSRCARGRSWALSIRDGVDGMVGESGEEREEVSRQRHQALRHALWLAQGGIEVSEVTVIGEPDAALELELRRCVWADNHFKEALNEQEKAEEAARASRKREQHQRERDAMRAVYAKLHRGSVSRSVPDHLLLEKSA